MTQSAAASQNPETQVAPVAHRRPSVQAEPASRRHRLATGSQTRPWAQLGIVSRVVIGGQGAP